MKSTGRRTGGSELEKIIPKPRIRVSRADQPAPPQRRRKSVRELGDGED
jgi:hypothetical protein